MLPPVSCRLSTYRHSLLGSSCSRPGSPAFLTVSLPVTTEVLIGPCRGFHVPHMSDAAGVGAPYGPGDGDALTVDGSQIDCHLPLPNGQSLHPATRPVCGAQTCRGFLRGSLAFTRPAFPLPVVPDRSELLGVSSELHTPPLPVTHVGVGTGHRTLTRDAPRTSSVPPPHGASTEHVRPRVARNRRCRAEAAPRPSPQYPPGRSRRTHTTGETRTRA